jgi:hypothetical protein
VKIINLINYLINLSVLQGTVAGRHLKLVMSKLESIYRAHATKKKTSALFFGLLRDRSGEEQQVGIASGFIFVEPDQERVNSIYRAHATKKKTSALFFGLLRDRSGKEQQVGNTSGVHFCGTGSGKNQLHLPRPRHQEEDQHPLLWLAARQIWPGTAGRKYFRGSFLWPDQERVNSIYRAHATKKKTSAIFFGLLRDRSGEEQQVGNTSGVHFCGTVSGMS